jgi:hypothetical protein
MKHTTEITSGGMIYPPGFMKIGSSIQVILRLDGQTDTTSPLCAKYM